MKAEILCVGTELLMGQIVNTNARFLASRLAALGITHQYQTVVGDNPGRLEEAYRLALSRSDVVITVGGLGPTVDDITKKSAAKVLGKELVLRPEAEEMVRLRFHQFHRDMPLNNLSQAMFTADTLLLLNDHGTAPGAIVPAGEGKVIIHLPGPPRELEPMFLEKAEPWLRQRSGQTLVSRYIYIFGMGESAVDALLADLETRENPTLSPYCSTGEVTLRATARAEDEAAAAELLEGLLREVRSRLGDVIYDIRPENDGSLALRTVELLKEKHLTVATAESLTGGLIAATLVNISGASEVVRGGFVTYQTDTKTELLGVPAETIDRFGVVSCPVAEAMAKGARERLGTDIAVSATGLAGPGGGTEETPVGTVCLGIAGKDGVRSVRLQLSGDRERIRTLSVKNALNLIRNEVLAL